MVDRLATYLIGSVEPVVQPQARSEIPKLAEEDVEAERDVILDEIAMHDDHPDDVVHNLFARLAYGDTPLGRPIAGSACLGPRRG